MPPLLAHAKPSARREGEQLPGVSGASVDGSDERLGGGESATRGERCEGDTPRTATR